MTERDRLEQALGTMHRKFRQSDPRPGALDSVLNGGVRRELRAVEDALNAQPDARQRAQDDAVQLALGDWNRYVTHQVKKADRDEWRTPTPERLAHRLGISEKRVRESIKRRGLTLPAAPDPFEGW